MGMEINQPLHKCWVWGCLFVVPLFFNSLAQAESYLYDAAGRLTLASYADGTLAFIYDNNGNILRRYRFLTPPSDPVCTSSEVTISGRVFTDHATCVASNWLTADTSKISAGAKVVFVAPTHELTNGFRVEVGSQFHIQTVLP